MANKPIFFDPSGKRARRLQIFRWLAGSAASLIVIAFSSYLLIISPSDTSDLKGHAAALFHLPLDGTSFDKINTRSTGRIAAELRAKQREFARDALEKRSHLPRTKSIPEWLSDPVGRALSIGFYANWDDNSLASLKRGLPHLDWVIPAWLNLQGPQMEDTFRVNDDVFNVKSCDAALQDRNDGALL